jgi:hypothetical protein
VYRNRTGGAGGVEPLTSAFTEPRANRYTTCRVALRANRRVILGGLEPPISSVSGRRPEPLGHRIIFSAEWKALRHDHQCFGQDSNLERRVRSAE